MKKFLTIATVGVLVLALAAVTYAVDLKASGIVRNRTGLYRNAEVGDISSAAGIDDTNSFVDYRSRLKFDLVASEDLQGTIYFETNDKWGLGGADVGADGNTLVVKNANISFTVPGTESFPTRATVGIQGFFLRSPTSIDDDAVGVTLDTKIEPAEIRLIYVKEDEGVLNAADDVDLYGGRLTIPMGDMRPFVWLLYRDIGGGAVTPEAEPTATNSSSDLYWVGLGLDGKIGSVSFTADFAYNAGDLDYSTPVGTIDKDEYGGYAFVANVSVPIAQFEVGADFLWTSGDDLEDVGTDGEFAGYRMPPGAAAYHPTTVLFSSGINDSVGHTSDINGGGIWMLKGYGSFKPLEWLKVTGYVAYLGDNVDEGDKFGTALDPASVTGLEDNDDIGFEVGVWADIEVYKGLVYSIAAGWLSAGDALDQEIAGVNESPDDPWALVSNLQYKF